MADSLRDRILSLLIRERDDRFKGGLYHQTQVKLAFNSNRIEGSRLSEDQTRYIFETNTIHTEANETASVDDIIETINHFDCFDFMLTTADEPITEELIKEFHRMLKRNTSDERKGYKVGDYKTRPNMVGEFKTTPPSKVADEMNRLLTQYASLSAVSIEDVVDFHYRLEIIHPFQDGNGRVGRMMMFKECLKHNLMPFIIDHTHKLFYYRGLKEYPTESGYLLGTCLSSQDDYASLVRYFYAEYGDNEMV
jgi:Fic family protein